MIDPDSVARGPQRKLGMLGSGGPVESHVIAHCKGERSAALNRRNSGERPSANQAVRNPFERCTGSIDFDSV